MLTAETVDAIHDHVRAAGWKLLQPYRYADSDEAHTTVVLSCFELPNQARVLDIGCGTGEAARLIKEQRPDLDLVLVNFSAAQLEDCPSEFPQHLADAHALPFGDETFDAVMFNFSLGNMDWPIALAEAVRVLKPGGLLLLNEIYREAGNGDEADKVLGYRPLAPEEFNAFLPYLGIESAEVTEPLVFREFLLEEWKTEWGDPGAVFSDAKPFILRAVKGEVTTVVSRTARVFHQNNVALALSGGKDSLAVLHLLRPFWGRLTVYWTNPGNPFPETLAQMAEIRKLVPHFKEVAGHQHEIIERDGWPSDVVPQAYTTDGNLVFGRTPFKVQPRLACCYRSLMAPMYEAMLADGITCCIRGKRREEKDRTGLEDGYVSKEGMRLSFPILEWTEGQVLGFLEAAGVELPEFYAYAKHSLDCMDCTAWWGEGLSRFLEAKHPAAFNEYRRRVFLIKQAVADQMAECEV